MVMKVNKMVLDDKKIEEAARGAADLYEQDLPIMSYDEDTEVDGQHHFCQEFGAELFKDGVKWAINEFLKGLWHDASKVPKERNENIIVLQDEDDEDEGNPLYAGLIHARHDTFPWDEFCEDNDIYKWCYFKEIAPRKGGKQ